MDFEELMYSPVMSRDIGRSFIMPNAQMGLGPVIYPYYGLQPLQPQPGQDTFVNPKKKKSKKALKVIGGILLGAAALVGGGLLLKKFGGKIKLPEIKWSKIGDFFKGLFKKAPATK